MAHLDPTEIRARILAVIAAEARRAADEGVAPMDDIATALRLGAAHPDDAVAMVLRA